MDCARKSFENIRTAASDTTRASTSTSASGASSSSTSPSTTRTSTGSSASPTSASTSRASTGSSASPTSPSTTRASPSPSTSPSTSKASPSTSPSTSKASAGSSTGSTSASTSRASAGSSASSTSFSTTRVSSISPSRSSSPSMSTASTTSPLIYCYTCGDVNHSPCPDPFSTIDQQVSVIYIPRSQYCLRKTPSKTASSQVIRRQALPSECSSSGCYKDASSTEVCCCNDRDGCNTAGLSTRSTFVLIFTSLIMLAFFL